MSVLDPISYGDDYFRGWLEFQLVDSELLIEDEKLLKYFSFSRSTMFYKKKRDS